MPSDHAQRWSDSSSVPTHFLSLVWLLQFGLLRFSFVVVSIFGAVLASNLFTLWTSENVIEAWMEFLEAKLFSAKKGACAPRESCLAARRGWPACLQSSSPCLLSRRRPVCACLSIACVLSFAALYLELMLQLTLYLFMSISTVDWSGLLIVLAAYYLDAKRWNFLLMYLVLVTISILFDLVHAASLPSFDNMTPGESFGASLWVMIFALKPLIIATIYAYEKYEKPYEDVGGPQYAHFKDGGDGLGDDDIAE